MGGFRRPRPVLFASVIASLALLAGCNSDDSSGSNARNPGEEQPISSRLSSFTVDENLERTVYKPFFEAITPNAADPDVATAAAIVSDIGRVMQPFIHWSNPGEGGAANYQSVRNTVDLMTRILYNNEIGNFQEGREYIGRAIDRGEPARYQNDLIQFSTAEGNSLTSWSYILAWVYIAEAEGDDPAVSESEEFFNTEIQDAVVRVILATNTTGSQITMFPARDFRTSGPQTTPDAQITSFTLGDADPESLDPAATLNQSWIDKEDLWTWTSETPESFGDFTGVRCAHLRIDYAMDLAYLYTSAEPSRVGLEGADPDDPGADKAENPLCGARNEDGSYRTANRSWSLDPADSPDRQ